MKRKYDEYTNGGSENYEIKRKKRGNVKAMFEQRALSKRNISSKINNRDETISYNECGEYRKLLQNQY